MTSVLNASRTRLYSLLWMDFAGIASWERLAVAVGSGIGVVPFALTTFADRPLVAVLPTAISWEDRTEHTGWRVIFLARLQV